MISMALVVMDNINGTHAVITVNSVINGIGSIKQHQWH